MIKIDTDKIEEWEEIKKEHKKKCIDEISKKVKIYSISDFIAKKFINDYFIEDLVIGNRQKFINCINTVYATYGICELTYNILTSFLNSKGHKKNIPKIFKEKEYACKKIAYTTRKDKNRIHEKYHNFRCNYYKHFKRKSYIKGEIPKGEKRAFLEKYYYNYLKYLDELEFIKIIFNYDEVIDSVYRHKLLSKMDIKVCPYCNRLYITSYSEKGEKRTTADLDHFYPKSIYPWLSISLYNFIPSCTICNSRMKGSKNFKEEPHIYPYEESFDENGAKFGIKYNCIINKNVKLYEIMNPESKFSIILTNPYRSKKVDNSIETFKLEKVYQIHKNHVVDILKKKHIYNKARIEELKNSFPKILKSEEEIKKLIYGTDIDKIDIDTPLSKLTRDIVNSNY